MKAIVKQNVNGFYSVTIFDDDGLFEGARTCATPGEWQEYCIDRGVKAHEIILNKGK